MPTFRHGKTTGVYLAGQNVSPYFNSADVGREIETHETTGFESEAKEYIVGQSDGTISLSGLFDSNVAGTGAEEMLNTAADQDTEFPASVFMDGGVAVGRACRIASVRTASYNVSSAVGDVVSAKADLGVNGGVAYGKCLNAKAPITGTVTGTAVDWGVAAPTGDWVASSGGFANIHPIDNTRTTATEVKIQFSADSSVWVDAATVSIPSLSRVGINVKTTLANTRYVRALITPVAGTGSATIVVAFARAAA